MFTNLQILQQTNSSFTSIQINEGEVLTVENSDIAFHANSIINSLDLTDINNIKHYSPYDTERKWKPKTIKMMYLLTKNINNNVLKLLELPIPRFIAISITGLGGTEIEPNVPNYKETFVKIKRLIDSGFDVNDIVIRIDPLYPGINTPDVNTELLTEIITTSYKLGIKQIYTSVFDIYKSTSKRMLELLDLSKYENGINEDNVLHCKKEYLIDVFTKIDNLIFTISNGNIQHILCGETSDVIPTHALKIGCLNKQRIEQTLHCKVTGIKDRDYKDTNVQRGNCLCVITDKGKKVKRQGLTEKQKCGHGCIGCYISSNQKNKLI